MLAAENVEVLATMAVIVALDLVGGRASQPRPLLSGPHPLRATRGFLRRTRRDLRLQTRLFADPSDARFLPRLVGQIVLVLAAAVAGGISVGLLALSGGPSLTSRTTMYEAFGYGGLTPSLILLLRVVTAAIREGR